MFIYNPNNNIIVVNASNENSTTIYAFVVEFIERIVYIDSCLKIFSKLDGSLTSIPCESSEYAFEFIELFSNLKNYE